MKNHDFHIRHESHIARSHLPNFIRFDHLLTFIVILMKGLFDVIRHNHSPDCESYTFLFSRNFPFPIYMSLVLMLNLISLDFPDWNPNNIAATSSSVIGF